MTWDELLAACGPPRRDCRNCRVSAYKPGGPIGPCPKLMDPIVDGWSQEMMEYLLTTPGISIDRDEAWPLIPCPGWEAKP